MKPNISNIDKGARILAAAIIAILYFANIITGTLGIVLLVVGAVLALTAFLNFCPIYAVLGLSTRKKED